MHLLETKWWTLHQLPEGINPSTYMELLVKLYILQTRILLKVQQNDPSYVGELMARVGGVIVSRQKLHEVKVPTLLPRQMIVKLKPHL